MATIIERDVHHSGSDGGASSMLIAVIAIVVIAGFALFAYRYLPIATPNDADTRGTIDINVNDTTPDANQ